MGSAEGAQPSGFTPDREFPAVPAGISESLRVSLGALFGEFAAFEFALDRVGWFGEVVVWLGPRDPTPFTALTNLVFTAFPSCPPYGEPVVAPDDR